MKSKLTLLFLLIASVGYAQYDYYYNESMFGMGVGYNFVSIVDNDVRPLEASFRYRINSSHTLQLYIPFLKQDDSFKSKDNSEMDLINTSLSTKRRFYGVGFDYDYALRSYYSLDFLIGVRTEFHLYEYRTKLVNTHSSASNYSNIEYIFRDKKNSGYVVSPTAGMRLNLNRFSVDAKFLLSMVSTSGDVNNSIEIRKGKQPNLNSTTKEWTDHISSNFKLKPGIAVSISYFL